MGEFVAQPDCRTGRLHGTAPDGLGGGGGPPPYRSVRRRCTGTRQTTVSGEQSRVVELVPV